MADAATTRRERSRWTLLTATLAEQRRNLIIGTLIGLAWMVGKVAVPRLVGFGIDRGIEGDDNVWMWSGLVAAAGIVAGQLSQPLNVYPSLVGSFGSVIEASYRISLGST